ncbi:MAG: hypothetical protein GXP25_15130 [Planctomycetes bacterium]|nr:hypothetical protein [Planctomycetota bacterium]
MKRLLLVVLALVFFTLTAHADDWEIEKGQWEITKRGLSGKGFCVASYKKPISEKADIQFALVVREWVTRVGPNPLIAFCWNHTENGRAMLIFTKSTIMVHQVQAGERKKLQSMSFDVPLNRSIPVRIRLTTKGIKALVGKQKVDVPLDVPTLERLCFQINGADASFAKVKIKSK